MNTEDGDTVKGSVRLVDDPFVQQQELTLKEVKKTAVILRDTQVVMFANPLSGSRKAKKWLNVQGKKDFELLNGTTATL